MTRTAKKMPAREAKAMAKMAFEAGAEAQRKADIRVACTLGGWVTTERLEQAMKRTRVIATKQRIAAVLRGEVGK